MRIKFLGSGREVGRSAIYVKAANETFLLDYGVKLTPDKTEYPTEPGKVDAVLLSHGHLDHCGYLPYLYRENLANNVYGTAPTFDLAHILIEDSIKLFRLKKEPKKYTNEDYEKMRRKEKQVRLGKAFQVRKAEVMAYDAGHIPGSSSFYVEDGKTLLYSGDIMLHETRLMAGMEPSYPHVDCLIMESTYSGRNHTPREEEEKLFAQRIKDVLGDGGTVMLPTFAVGRAQEVLLILDRWLKWKHPVYLDGMAVRATEAILRHPGSLRDHGLLEKAFSLSRVIRDYKQRKRTMEQPCIIVTTSGQLEGGPIVGYIKNFYRQDDCGIFLTGFQIPGNAGRTLLDTGVYRAGGLELDVKCAVEYFDFSSHAGRDELIQYASTINPVKVIVNHGDRCQPFAKELREQGFDAEAPENGGTIEI